jgi:quinol-cytochrome oxidoreductase complex cytochrome b subunit
MEKARQTTVGKSIVRAPDRSTPRDRAAGHWSNFFLHIYPVKMRRAEIAPRFTWYLGVISSILFGSLVLSGVYLMFFYVPSPGTAFANIQNIQTSVPFGQYIRNVHRWSAHLMVIAVAMHLCKVFYKGAYKPPREFNWVIGVVLLLLTLFMSFTGYLLPWDQLAYWAVTVGTEMASYVPLIGDQVRDMLLGGPIVGEATLVRFYVLHVAVIPLLITFALTLHLWRWRKDTMLDTATPEAELAKAATLNGNGAHVTGEATAPAPAPAPAMAAATVEQPVVIGNRRVLGVVPGKPPVGERKDLSNEDVVMVWPHLLVRHMVAALGTMLVVLALGVFVDAPLHEVANPNITPNPEKAPWYFAAMQELLAQWHPLVAGVLVPGTLVVGLGLLPYIDRNPYRLARHRKVAVVVFTTFLVIWIGLTLIGFAFRGPNWSWVWPWESWHGVL